jgi:hypothetical protein
MGANRLLFNGKESSSSVKAMGGLAWTGLEAVESLMLCHSSADLICIRLLHDFGSVSRDV